MAVETIPPQPVVAQTLASAPIRINKGAADAAPVRSPQQARLDGRIFDIRRSRQEEDLVLEIRKGLDVAAGAERRLPTMLLYDEQGLKLFEEVTYLDEYYLTNAEIDLLATHADSMAQHIPDNAIFVELGSGNLRKIDILLQAFDRHCKKVEYYALDLSLPELERTLAEIPRDRYQHVSCYGLWGTYDDGLELLKAPQFQTRPKWIASVGSSIGNFPREAAPAFLGGFAAGLGPQDRLFVAIDSCKDPERVYHAYNDSLGTTHRFVLNGLQHANAVLGYEAFVLDDWQVIGEYDVEHGRHHAFVSPRRPVTIEGVALAAGERIRIEESYKYSPTELDQLWQRADVVPVACWANARNDYAMHLITKPKHAFPVDPLAYAAQPAPAWEEWGQLWQLWDNVTRQMLPDDELLEKPIKLRNACIFYLGHIPAFFDIKLTETFPADGPTAPASYHSIFERGIDPDVDDPDKCHAHSEIPDSWPPVAEMLAYQERVRQRVKSIYDRGDAQTVKGARALWLGYEHEAMHLETLLYMLVQSDKTRPPAYTPEPVFATLADHAAKRAVENQWFTIPEQHIPLGLNDPETDDGPLRYFGWDIEKPARSAHVKSFQAKARPITNGEYAEYLHHTGTTSLPASWRELSAAASPSPQTNGHATTPSCLTNKTVRTVFGDVPLEHVQYWPVAASYDELQACAAWMGGRIPTLEETRSIYHFVETTGKAADDDERRIPAVNNHLINNGVPESPPANGHAGAGGRDPRELFVRLAGCNVGFHQWTPTSVVERGDRLAGQADFGGLWEWTSSPLAKHEGYEPMKLYPAYSSDFLDGRHNVVLGGSWATVPRIAGRKTFVNWYQRNYPYAWAGARLVRDL